MGGGWGGRGGGGWGWGGGWQRQGSRTIQRPLELDFLTACSADQLESAQTFPRAVCVASLTLTHLVCVLKASDFRQNL